MRTDGLAERLEGRLARGQAAAEARMTDTFEVYVWPAPGEPVPKDDDGFEIPGPILNGETPGRVQGSGRDTETTYVEVAGVDRPVATAHLHIPNASALPVAGQRGRGWEYLCTASLLNPALVGRRFLVWEVSDKSQQTARRLTVVEVTDGRSS